MKSTFSNGRNFSRCYPQLIKFLSKRNASETLTEGFPASLWWYSKECGHEWKLKISGMRTRGTHCRVCSGGKILEGFNDLMTLRPHLREKWATERNGPYGGDLAEFSNKHFWWRCPQGHEFQEIPSRVTDASCRQCSLEERSLALENPSLLEYWAFDLNALSPWKLEPSTFSPGDDFWWRCHLGHIWSTKNLHVKYRGELKCPFCSNAKILNGFNDLAALFPALSKQAVNGGEGISPKSKERIEWICHNGHLWLCSPYYRLKNGQYCPYCTHKKVFRGYNDVASVLPEAANYWIDPDISIEAVTYTDFKSYLWKCPTCAGSFKRSPRKWSSSRVCSRCSSVSNLELEVRDFLVDTLGAIVTENDRAIIAPQELDILIEDLKIAVEVNGVYWHSSEALQEKGYSAKEFHKMKLEACAKEGYELLFVWEDDWNEQQKVVEACLASALRGDFIHPMLRKLVGPRG